MKPLYRCDYCTETGTAEEITNHEETCFYNYTKRSCHTCKNVERKVNKYICKAGKEIPEGCCIEHCPNYKWNEYEHGSLFPTLFGNLFKM